jgi:flagellin
LINADTAAAALVDATGTTTMVVASAASASLSTGVAEVEAAGTTTVDNLSVATRTQATVTIASVDAALEDIDEIRGGLGAIQNRFESTIANLNNVSENLSAARSRILDADIAMETSAMTKSNILQQAGIAILAQANQMPAMALSLLS